MEIEKVELLGTTKKEKKEGMRKVFYVKTTDGNKKYVPVDEPLNRDYQEIAAWYNEQEEKPFTFDFE